MISHFLTKPFSILFFFLSTVVWRDIPTRCIKKDTYIFVKRPRRITSPAERKNSVECFASFFLLVIFTGIEKVNNLCIILCYTQVSCIPIRPYSTRVSYQEKPSFPQFSYCNKTKEITEAEKTEIYDLQIFSFDLLNVQVPPSSCSGFTFWKVRK